MDTKQMMPLFFKGGLGLSATAATTAAAIAAALSVNYNAGSTRHLSETSF